MTELRSELHSLSTLFGSRNLDSLLSLPDYQRPYVWGTKGTKNDHVTKLAEDIVRNIKRNNMTTFFGAMVVMDQLLAIDKEYNRANIKKKRSSYSRPLLELLGRPKDSGFKTHLLRLTSSGDFRPKVVDGQQRLTTLLICCGVLKKLSHDTTLFPGVNGNTKFGVRKRSTISNLLDNYSLDEEGELRFEIAERDRHHCRDYCKNPTDPNIFQPGPGRGKVWPVKQASDRMYKVWKKYLKSIPVTDRKSIFAKLYIHVTENTKFVVSYVNNKTQAHVVFQSLNRGGEPLSLGDLLYSFIQYRASEFTKTVQRDTKANLREIINNLDHDPMEEDRLTDFFHRYWLSTAGEVAMNDAFEAFENHLNNLDKTKFQSYIADIKRAASHYSSIRAASITGIGDDLSDFNTSFKQHYPLLMAALSRGFTDTQMRNFMDLICVLYVRYDMARASGRGGRVLGPEYSEWSLLIRKHGYNAVTSTTLTNSDGTHRNCITEDIIELIKMVNCDNSTGLLSSFESGGLSETQAKFILRSTYHNGAFPGGYDTKIWSAEHIAPLARKYCSPKSDWDNYGSQREQKMCKGMLGNYIVIRGRLNSQLNKSMFISKLAKFRSAVNETSQLKDFADEFYGWSTGDSVWAEKRNWTPEDIIARTRELSAPIPAKWPMPTV